MLYGVQPDPHSSFTSKYHVVHLIFLGAGILPESEIEVKVFM